MTDHTEEITEIECRTMKRATSILGERKVAYDKVIGDESQAVFWNGNSPAARFVVKGKRAILEIYGVAK